MMKNNEIVSQNCTEKCIGPNEVVADVGVNFLAKAAPAHELECQRRKDKKIMDNNIMTSFFSPRQLRKLHPARLKS